MKNKLAIEDLIHILLISAVTIMILASQLQALWVIH